MLRPPPTSPLFPYTTLSRSADQTRPWQDGHGPGRADVGPPQGSDRLHLNGSRQAEAAVLAKADRTSTRLNSTHAYTSNDRLCYLRPTASAALGRDPHQPRVV